MDEHEHKNNAVEALKLFKGDKPAGDSFLLNTLRADGALRTAEDIAAEAWVGDLRKRIDGHASDVIARVEANELEAASIRKLAQLIATGAKCIDITFRKDGRDYRYQGDWIARLFREPCSDQLRNSGIQAPTDGERVEPKNLPHQTTGETGL